jgi:hypothetical protein
MNCQWNAPEIPGKYNVNSSARWTNVIRFRIIHLTDNISVGPGRVYYTFRFYLKNVSLSNIQLIFSEISKVLLFFDLNLKLRSPKINLHTVLVIFKCHCTKGAGVIAYYMNLSTCKEQNTWNVSPVFESLHRAPQTFPSSLCNISVTCTRYINIWNLTKEWDQLVIRYLRKKYGKFITRRTKWKVKNPIPARN